MMMCLVNNTDANLISCVKNNPKNSFVKKTTHFECNFCYNMLTKKYKIAVYTLLTVQNGFN